MNATTKSVLVLVGRVLLSQIFLFSGAMKIVGWDKTAEMMQAHGMFAVPFFLAAAIVVEIGAGLLVLLGWKTRWAAAALFLFLIPVTAIFHDFWKYDGPAKENQLQHFSKNVTILGGLVTLLAAGAGQFSFDAWLMRRRRFEHQDALVRDGSISRPKFEHAHSGMSHERT